MLLVRTASHPYSLIRLIRPFRHVKIPPGASWDLSKFLNRDHRCPASRPTTEGAALHELVLQECLALGEPEVPSAIAAWPRAGEGGEGVQHGRQKPHVLVLGSAEGSAGWWLCPHSGDLCFAMSLSECRKVGAQTPSLALQPRAKDSV